MSKTHKEIVEEIKAEVPPNVREYVDKIALAAAHGAAEAAKVDKEKTEWIPGAPNSTETFSMWNAAIAQSQRQIEEHFRS